MLNVIECYRPSSEPFLHVEECSFTFPSAISNSQASEPGFDTKYLSFFMHRGPHVQQTCLYCDGVYYWLISDQIDLACLPFVRNLPGPVTQLKSKVIFALCRIDLPDSVGVECPAAGCGGWPYNHGGAQSFSCSNNSSSMAIIHSVKHRRAESIIASQCLLLFLLKSCCHYERLGGSQASGLETNTEERGGKFRGHFSRIVRSTQNRIVLLCYPWNWNTRKRWNAIRERQGI
jgi:hypothetical protein